jgi:hypothetical protein
LNQCRQGAPVLQFCKRVYRGLSDAIAGSPEGFRQSGDEFIHRKLVLFGLLDQLPNLFSGFLLVTIRSVLQRA